MKIRILVLSFLLPCIAFGQSSFDVLHYKYSLEINDNNDTIYGKAEIKLVLKERTVIFSFDLSSAEENKKGMELVRTGIKPSAPSKNFMLKSASLLLDKVSFYTSNELSPGDTVDVSIEYKGVPDDGLIISKNKFGHRTFFADNWPNRAHHWIPCVDDPSDKATVEFIVTAPSHYQVVSNGIMIEESNLADNKKLTHYKEDVPLPTKVMVIGVADFAVNLAGEINCIPVYSWVFPEERKKGFYDYALAKDVLSYYINYIGPFPYKKLANVQSKTIFGGMENAGAIFYHENSVDGQRGEEYLFAHEIVHQWFGDMATEKSFPHLWLSEGFATYLTHVYAESKIGYAKFNQRMKDDREQVIDFVRSSPKPVVDSASAFLQLLNANSYQRGSWVLHMLRRQLGDSVFKRSVRSYYEQYKGKNAETKDLQAVFEKISGKNLDIFFRQWVHTAAIPKLDITWKYDVDKNNVTVTVKQLQKGSPFSFPLDIFVSGSGKSQPISKTVIVSGKADIETFYISTASIAMVQQVQIDPSVSLLFDGTVKQVK